MSVAREVARSKTQQSLPDLGELRPVEEILPRLGAKPGMATARVGNVTVFDKPLQEIAGNLATSSLKLPLRLQERKHVLILAWVLEPVDAGGLMRALVRSSHPDGTIWVITYKKEYERPGTPSWDELLKAALGAGWVDNKILPIGAQLQATRFLERRPGARSASGGMRGRTTYAS
ncbi:MAG: hypothetical protein AUH85_06790 [Chloroflexi bacterium 13_1_40CM_4_68_4]|nr:MAG: hypothetical protein AUH85_06790 [Chloroflexi bacterium 13_1_40CM_4_68_4]